MSSKDKVKNTSILARRRLRQHSGNNFGNEQMEFKGKVVKTADKTQVYFGSDEIDLRKNR